MSLIVLALVLWIVVVPALVVVGALYMPRGLLRRLTGSGTDDGMATGVASIGGPESITPGLTRRSA